MTVHLHYGDLPDNLDLGKIIAIDTETMGLNPIRDRLCLIQISAGDGECHLVKFRQNDYSAPNLKKILQDQSVTKIFHFARFDVAVLWVYLGILVTPIYCTKIASKLVRTFTQYHGLKNLCNELIGVSLDKKEQTSDWGSDSLSKEQMDYAASDVLYLHKLKEKLDIMLEREGRTGLAQACFDFLPHRAVLDIAGWVDEDIFSH